MSKPSVPGEPHHEWEFKRTPRDAKWNSRFGKLVFNSSWPPDWSMFDAQPGLDVPFEIGGVTLQTCLICNGLGVEAIDSRVAGHDRWAPAWSFAAGRSIAWVTECSCCNGSGVTFVTRRAHPAAS